MAPDPLDAAGAAGSGDPASRLGLTIGPPVNVDGALCFPVAGEIDMISAGAFESALRDAVRDAPRGGVVVDLDQVTFLDSTGLSALFVGFQLAARAGLALRVVNPRGTVRRVLAMTGVLEALTDD